jgi:hypothetical protein
VLESKLNKLFDKWVQTKEKPCLISEGNYAAPPYPDTQNTFPDFVDTENAK